MLVSDNGINLIKQFEGCRLTSYKPVPWEAMYTIGWGHYGVPAGVTWTQEQADKQLVQDLNVRYVPIVQKYTGNKANQNEFDALVSLVYNCGDVFTSDGWKPFSHDYVAGMLPKYVNAGGKPLDGLVRRRQAELKLFNTPVQKVTVNQLKKEKKMFFVQTVDTKHVMLVTGNGMYSRVPNPAVLTNLRKELGLPTVPMTQAELDSMFNRIK